MEIKELKQIAKTKRITYQKISDASGIPLNTIKSIFSFRVTNPRIDTMQAIEKALGLSNNSSGLDSGLDNAITLRSDELRLLEAYNQLIPPMQNYAVEMIESLVSTTNSSETGGKSEKTAQKKDSPIKTEPSSKRVKKLC